MDGRISLAIKAYYLLFVYKYFSKIYNIIQTILTLMSDQNLEEWIIICLFGVWLCVQIMENTINGEIQKGNIKLVLIITINDS